VLQGDSFEELIAVTKARDAARRAARAAATAAAAEEEQEMKEQEKESKEEEQQQQQEASPDESKPPEQKEDEEQKPAPAADHPEPVLPDVTREEMLAEEVRQAHEVSLLDSDDDNW
jgi:hypothetical protein